jgi:hypothetical protein
MKERAKLFRSKSTDRMSGSPRSPANIIHTHLHNCASMAIDTRHEGLSVSFRDWQKQIYDFGTFRSGSFQNTERDGGPAHVVKAPCRGGLITVNFRSGRMGMVAESSRPGQLPIGKV